MILPVIYKDIPSNAENPADMLRHLAYENPNARNLHILPTRRSVKSMVPLPISDLDFERFEESTRCLASMKSFHDLSALRKDKIKGRSVTCKLPADLHFTTVGLFKTTEIAEPDAETEQFDQVWYPRIKKIDSFVQSPKSKRVLGSVGDFGNVGLPIIPTLNIEIGLGPASPSRYEYQIVQEEKKIIFRDLCLSDFRIVFPYLYKQETSVRSEKSISDIDLSDILEILNISKKITIDTATILTVTSICNFLYAFVLSDAIFSSWEIDVNYRPIIRAMGVKLMNMLHIPDKYKAKKYQYDLIYKTSYEILQSTKMKGATFARKL